jgi:ribosomal-protein-alanine N-acetyltransferase
MPGQSLRTERLSLLLLDREEIVALASLAGGAIEPNVIGAPGYPARNTGNACEAALSQPSVGINGLWLIVSSASGLAIGDCVFLGGTPPGEHSIAYQIADSHHNQHFGKEAVLALVDWAFEQPEVTALQAQVEESNTASKRILEAASFADTGRETGYGRIWRRIR